jgi:predicted transcriptional regulator
MRNITFSADEDQIDRARAIAREKHMTLNDAFRDWLARFSSSRGDVEAFDDLMERLKDVNAGRHFSRDELNER